MKKILTLLFDFACARLGRGRHALYNDALRANQFGDPAHTFSYWRSLVI